MWFNSKYLKLMLLNILTVKKIIKCSSRGRRLFNIEFEIILNEKNWNLKFFEILLKQNFYYENYFFL